MLSLISTFRASTLMAPNAKVLVSQSRLPMLEISSGLKTRSLESRLGIAEKPKKPLTPFFRFMTEIRASVTAAHPQLTLQEVVKAIGVKWETVDEAKKQQYMNAYKQDQAEYLQKRAQYDLSLTDEQRMEIKELKQKISDNRVKSAERKRVRELGRPKRAMSPFLLYLNDAKLKFPRSEKETYREWQVRSSKQWYELPDAVKEPYFTKSRELITKYSDELLQWEEKMVRQGNVDLVRTEMLIEPIDRKTKPRKPKAAKSDEKEGGKPQ